MRIEALTLNECHHDTRDRVNVEYVNTSSSIETTLRPPTEIPIEIRYPAMLYTRPLHIFAESLAGWPARAGETPLKKGEKCHQVLCRIEGMEGSESQRGPNADERRKTKRS